MIGEEYLIMQTIANSWFGRPLKTLFSRMYRVAFWQARFDQLLKIVTVAQPYTAIYHISCQEVVTPMMMDLTINKEELEYCTQYVM